jgi:hypothetical protein
LRDLGKVVNRRFEPNERDQALVRMTQAGIEMSVWRPALLWQITRVEFLVRDFLIHWLEPRFEAGTLRLRVGDVHSYVTETERRGQDGKPWSERTRERVASGLLGIGADLGLLKGGTVKECGSQHLPEEAFLYVRHAIGELAANRAELIRSQEWQMYLYQPEEVERELLRLHQIRKLHYERAGSIVALSLPFRNGRAVRGEFERMNDLYDWKPRLTKGLEPLLSLPDPQPRISAYDNLPFAIVLYPPEQEFAIHAASGVQGVGIELSGPTNHFHMRVTLYGIAAR